MPDKLTAQEEQAMRAAWKAGEANVKTILEHLAPPVPPYTTLASTLKNLEKKGWLISRPVGNMNLYSAAIKEADYTSQSITSMVRLHFDNSYKALVASFVEHQKISPKELKEIIALIEKKK